MTSDLQDRLLAALDDAAAHCPAEPCRSADWSEIVKVGDFHVRESAFCPASLAAPEPPFEADMFKTFKTIALDSLADVKQGMMVRAAVSETMRTARDGDGWYSDFLRSAPESVRVQTAVRATTWLTRTIEVLGTDDLRGWSIGTRIDFRHPDVALMLQGKFDLDIGGHRLVAAATSPSKAEIDTVAYLTLLWRVVRSKDPDEVLLAVHSTGMVESYSPSLLHERGVEVAARAASAVSRRGFGPEDLPRTPAYFTCQSCAWRDDCEERLEHEASSKVRGGIRLALPG